MPDQGWISLDRKVRGHWLWKSSRVKTRFEAWVDMLMEANHEPKKVLIGNELIDCDRGECLNSLRTWATRWSWSVSGVRRFLEILTKNGTVLVKKATHNTTHLKILNYDTYQDQRTEDETNLKRKRNKAETKLAPNNNDNNENNDNKNKATAKKHLFKDSPIFDKAKFKERFPDWPDQKLRHWYDQAVEYSGANGKKYLDWGLAIQNWCRRSDQKVNGVQFERRDRDQLPGESRNDYLARKLREA